MDYEMDYLDELQFDQAEESEEDLLPAYLREPPHTHLRHAILQPAQQVLDGQGRPVGDGDVQAALPRQRGQQAG